MSGKPNSDMKKKLIARGLLKTLIFFGVAFAVLGACIWVYNQEFHRWLPTHSKANELRAASYGGSFGGELVVTLRYADGNKNVLDIKNGVIAGEPQKYPLPELAEGIVTVHIFFERHYLTCDMDVIVFNSSDELKRKGLLLYFMEGSGLIIISGEKRICYAFDNSINDWVVLETPYPIFNDPAGASPNDWASGWQNNKWEYIEVTQDQ